MSISLVTPPSAHCWSKNRIGYKFTWTGEAPGTKLKLIVAMDGVPYTSTAYPLIDAAGTMTIYVEDLIDAQLSFWKPSQIDGGPWVVAEPTRNNYDDFTVSWQRLHEDSSLGSHHLRVIKGGWSSLLHVDKVNTASFLPPAPMDWNSPTVLMYFVSWQRKGLNLIHPLDWHWLLLVGPDDLRDLGVYYTIEYRNGAVSSFVAMLPAPIGTTNRKWATWHVPAGLDQLGVNWQTNGGVAQYHVTLMNGGALYDKVTFKCDNRPRYQSRCLYFFNSFGGMDRVALIGDNEGSFDSEKKDTRVHPDYAPIAGSNPYYFSETGISWKERTGMLDRAAMRSLFDLGNTTSAFLLVRRKEGNLTRRYWVPVRVTGKQTAMEERNNPLQYATLSLETSGKFETLPDLLFDL